MNAFIKTTTLPAALLTLILSTGLAQDRDDDGPPRGDGPRIQPRIIIRNGDGEPVEMRGMPMVGDDVHRVNVLEILPEKDRIKVELVPATGILGTDRDTLFVKDGKDIRREDIPEAADVVGVYAPAIDRNASVVVQLGLDQQATLAQGMVRKVEDGKLLLRKALVDRLDLEGAVVLIDGKRGSAELLQPGMLVSVLASGTFDQPKALVVTRGGEGDQSVKIVKVRVAPGENRMPFGLTVVAGRPEEKVLNVDRNSRIERFRWRGFGRRGRDRDEDDNEGQLTLQALKDLLAKEKDLQVTVRFSPGRGDDKAEYLDRLQVGDGNLRMIPGGGRMVFPGGPGRERDDRDDDRNRPQRGENR